MPKGPLRFDSVFTSTGINFLEAVEKLDEPMLKEIADELDQQIDNTSTYIAELHQDGYVSKSKEGRGKKVELTEHGKKVLEIAKDNERLELE